MKITSIEPTPSPNTMMLHLDERLEAGIRRTYTRDNERSAPPLSGVCWALKESKACFIRRIL